MLGGKGIEDQQRFAILRQHSVAFPIFRLVGGATTPLVASLAIAGEKLLRGGNCLLNQTYCFHLAQLGEHPPRLTNRITVSSFMAYPS